jgi:hypothetical protein
MLLMTKNASLCAILGSNSIADQGSIAGVGSHMEGDVFNGTRWYFDIHRAPYLGTFTYQRLQNRVPAWVCVLLVRIFEHIRQTKGEKCIYRSLYSPPDVIVEIRCRMRDM